MNPRTYALISGITFLVGILFLAFRYELFIIRYPSYIYDTQNITITATKRKIPLIMWHTNGWHTTTEQLLIPDDSQEALHYILTSWMVIATEHTHTAKKISLQTALLGAGGRDLYLSFDKNPLPQQRSIFDKWMWIEGLLKTIHAYDRSIQRIHFLENHQLMTDRHLDFSHPWPIGGFNS